MDPAGGVLALDVGEEQRVLARVVRRRRGGVAAVIRGDDQQVAGAKRRKEVGEPTVEVLEATVEVDRVVAVSPEHVGLDEVREHEPRVQLVEQLLGLVDALDVRPRRVRVVDVDAREDVADLADGVNLLARVADEGQIVRLLRLQRPVVPVRRPVVAPRLTFERPGDDAADRVLAGQDLAGDLATVVQLVKWDRVHVRRDLEDGVGGGVDDPLAGALMLLAQLLDDLRPRGRLVPEHAAARSGA